MEPQGLPEEQTLSTRHPLSKLKVLFLFTIGTIVFLGIAVYSMGLEGIPLPFLPTQPQKACTQEVKTCPDGSTVGRTGPNCEFNPCPSKKQSGGLSLPFIWKTYAVKVLGLTFKLPPHLAPGDLTENTIPIQGGTLLCATIAKQQSQPATTPATKSAGCSFTTSDLLLFGSASPDPSVPEKQGFIEQNNRYYTNILNGDSVDITDFSERVNNPNGVSILKLKGSKNPPLEGLPTQEYIGAIINTKNSIYGGVSLLARVSDIDENTFDQILKTFQFDPNTPSLSPSGQPTTLYWRSYTNSRFGFTFRYPPAWFQGGDDTMIYLYNKPVGTLRDAFYETVRIFPAPYGPGEEKSGSIDDPIGTKKSIDDGVTTWEKVADLTIGGRKATKITLTTRLGNQIGTLVKVPSNSGRLIYVELQGKDPSDTEIFNQILTTFTFTEQK